VPVHNLELTRAMLLGVVNGTKVLNSLSVSSRKIQDIAGFKNWLIHELGKVFPFGAVACGYGRMHAGGVATDYIVTVNFPESHFQEICNRSGGIETPLLRRWLKTEKPFYFDPSCHHEWPEISPQWMNAFTKNDLCNAAVHAKFDAERFVGTYFSFHQLPVRLGEDGLNFLESLTPILHDALCQVITSVERQDQLLRPEWELLTQRELAVLTWVGRGRSNGEIAELICISESTVKHHISRIMQKLGLNNRVQLAGAYMTHPPGVVTKGTKVL
jgi:DNA-binding CsgD family transcriptional regulator